MEQGCTGRERASSLRRWECFPTRALGANAPGIVGMRPGRSDERGRRAPGRAAGLCRFGSQIFFFRDG